MDPIEKLLSELAPRPACVDLDLEMRRVFDRAERRSRNRRVLRSSVAMCSMLLIGVIAGYALQVKTTAPAAATGSAAPPAVTYVYPVQGERPMLDFSAPKAEWMRSPGGVFVEIHPAPAVLSSFNSGTR